MKNLIIGFILGYLICTYVLLGPQGVSDTIMQSFATAQVWGESAILWIQNYTPKA
jgi:hypothetical protein|tara:strand:+ start:384 stop:548 length:165 start_codon:yes stop_codon:yes gene_type:complete